MREECTRKVEGQVIQDRGKTGNIIHKEAV